MTDVGRTVTAETSDDPERSALPRTDQDRLLDTLMPLSRALVALVVRRLNEMHAELTLPQYRIMVVLATRGPQRTNDLAVEQQVRPSTITRACDRLIRRGLVCRYHSPPDRRIAWIALTERGRDLIGEVMRYRRAEFEKLLTAAGITSSDQLVEQMDALVRATGEPTDAQWWAQWARSADLPPHAIVSP